ncbi:hypothetical protein AAW51_3146 [Caldimonas brevitalea]|uniref:Uncharacterized protein n=1 Tax=Caldimonas brevitalea TaxID=413882 RepID=A0A0G3BKD3_9BURK|nr:hypothetical protein AAW51_3146 [Caldimonas brevitalea]
MSTPAEAGALDVSNADAQAVAEQVGLEAAAAAALESAGAVEWMREGGGGRLRGQRLPSGKTLNLRGLQPQGGTAPGPFTRVATTPLFSEVPGVYPSVYWWWVVRVDGLLAQPRGRYYAYYSTDHDSGNGGIAMAYANSPTGPWTSHGQVFVDTVRTRSPGKGQTETPSVVWDPLIGGLRMFYQQISAVTGGGPAVGVQTTLAATSRDGIAWAVDDSFKIDPNNAWVQAGNGHTGYFMPFVVNRRWVAYSLYGSGDYPHFAIHYADRHLGDWATDPRYLGHWTPWCRMADGVPRYVSWNHAFAVETPSGLMLVALLANYSSGSTPKNARLGVAPLSLDARVPLQPLRQVWAPELAWESGDLRSVTPLVDDGVLYVYYVVKAAGHYNVGCLSHEL